MFSARHEPAIEGLLLEQYIAGLRIAGWRGAEHDVELGYTATMALQYGVALIGFYVEALLDEQQHAFLERSFGESIEQFARHFVPWMEFAIPRAEQARRLL